MRVACPGYDNKRRKRPGVRWETVVGECIEKQTGGQTSVKHALVGFPTKERGYILLATRRPKEAQIGNNLAEDYLPTG